MDAEGSVRARIKWQPDGDRLRTMARTKRGTSLARGWRENSKLQQLAHSSTPLQFRARREFQCGLHAKPYSSSCKLPVRANHICFLPVHLSLHPPSISDHFTLAIPVFPLPSVLCFSLFSSLSLSLSSFFTLLSFFRVSSRERGRRTCESETNFTEACRSDLYSLLGDKVPIYVSTKCLRRHCSSDTLPFFRFVACNLIYFLVAVSHVVPQRRKLPPHEHRFLYLCYPALLYPYCSLYPRRSSAPFVPFRKREPPLNAKVYHFPDIY